MKKKYTYEVMGELHKVVYNYIPVRFVIAMVIMIIEVLLMTGIVFALCYYVPYFYLAAWATEIFCVIKIISSDENPDYKVPWLLFVLILPIVGFMLYFLFHSRTLSKRYIKRMEETRLYAYECDDSALQAQLECENAVAYRQAKMLCDIADTHLFDGTSQQYFSLGEHMHASMLQDLERAQHFIYMEFFIIEDGIFWDSILNILKQKAANGVQVRVLYDDIGCMSTLPGDYYKQLGRYGIEAVPFSLLRGNADGEFNNRSHRKILVIDGKVGYTGGVNLADEYINRVQKYGHWKDTAIRLEGRAVWELTRLFCVDFGINRKKLPDMPENAYPSIPAVPDAGYMIPFGDGPAPIYAQRVGKSVIINLLMQAVRYVYITTPYLIIDNELCSAMENAARRGVEVKIIVPHVPDKKLVLEMTRSYYKRLIGAGVQIYEYEPGFIHAKSYLADDELGMIGTINMDYRSLVHHFENGVWMYRCPCLADMKADFEATLQRSVKADQKAISPNLPGRIVRAFVRIFAPLL
ncbi:MAG: cardiolipin synthase [Clostridia bacterium]|nr:cardiolipin synthase [Clostridia bacterium]